MYCTYRDIRDVIEKEIYKLLDKLPGLFKYKLYDSQENYALDFAPVDIFNLEENFTVTAKLKGHNLFLCSMRNEDEEEFYEWHQQIYIYYDVRDEFDEKGQIKKDKHCYGRSGHIYEHVKHVTYVMEGHCDDEEYQYNFEWGAYNSWHVGSLWIASIIKKYFESTKWDSTDIRLQYSRHYIGDNWHETTNYCQSNKKINKEKK